MSELINFILKLLFGESSVGTIVISSSVPSVDIRTGWTPTKVFLSMDGSHGTSVCGSHQDWFNTKIIPHGFIIQCNLESSFRKIEWMAVK
jgi:hypothetical protein